MRELNRKPDSKLSLVDRLALYQEHRVDPRHLVPLYVELSARDTPLTLAEATILGLPTTVLIATTREMLRALPSNEGRNPILPGVQIDDVFGAIVAQIKLTLSSSTWPFVAKDWYDFLKSLSGPLKLNCMADMNLNRNIRQKKQPRRSGGGRYG